MMTQQIPTSDLMNIQREHSFDYKEIVHDFKQALENINGAIVFLI